ncbi:LecA/PA-IL family lectin [Pseudomonas sp. SDO52101_S400]
MASGWVERGSGRAYGPQGDESLVGSYKPAGLVYPDGLVGALLMKIGDDYLTPINNGVLRWTVPTDGELTFLVNDLAGDYGNNSGSFNVSVEKKTINTEPAADVLKRGRLPRHEQSRRCTGALQCLHRGKSEPRR